MDSLLPLPQSSRYMRGAPYDANNLLDHEARAAFLFYLQFQKLTFSEFLGIK